MTQVFAVAEPERPAPVAAAATKMHNDLTIQDVARGLQISERTVYNLISQGWIGVVRINRLVRIREEEYERFRRTGTAGTILPGSPGTISCAKPRRGPLWQRE
jgi:excisionase family DNA binding protein